MYEQRRLIQKMIKIGDGEGGDINQSKTGKYWEERFVGPTI